jgi:hypothetical protein
MLKPGVYRRRIYVIGQSKLFNSPEPLEPGMLHDLENEVIGNRYESIHGVVDDLPFPGFVFHELQMLKEYKNWLCHAIKAILQHFTNTLNTE